MNRPKPKRLLWAILILCGGLAIFGYSVFWTRLLLADIRPHQLSTSPLATLWYERAVKAHGGRPLWQQTKQAHYDMTAIFPDFVFRTIMGPFRTNTVKLHWEYTPQQTAPMQIQAVYQDGGKELYNLSKQGSFRIVRGKRDAEPWRFQFFARSIRHLLDFVFVMNSADVRAYAGEARWKGQTYVRILMTWKDPHPNPKFDQYLLWINKKSHLLERFDCTGRAVLPFLPSPFLIARVEFGTYHQSNGFQVPSFIKVYRGLKSRDLAHSYVIHKASFR